MPPVIIQEPGQLTVNEGEGEEATTRTVECDSLRMTLDQDVNLDYPDNLKVTGTLFIDDYSCLKEANWPELIPLPKPGEVESYRNHGYQ